MKKTYYLIILFLIGLFLYSANIWGISIYSLDEAKNATCAKEMIERGDYIVPTFNYELRTDKPPMHYYFMIVAYKLFGFNEFSARVFSSLFGFFTLILTFLFTKKVLGEKTALLASLVLISSLHASLQFHMAVPDPYLIFYLNGVFFSFYLWYKEKKEKFVYTMYTFIGLGILTKGPVAVVLPSLIIFLFLVYTHTLNLQTIKQLRLLRGTLIILTISLPWYIAVGLKTDWVWVYEFIFKHNLHRFSNSMEGHGGIFILPFLFVFFGLLPFSVFFVQAFLKAWQNKYKEVLVYLMIVSLVYIGFFSVSGTKLPNYTTPTYPALSILLGYFLANFSLEKNKKLYINASIVTLIILSVVISIGVAIGIKNEKPVADLFYLGAVFSLWAFGGITALLTIRKSTNLAIGSIAVSSIVLITVFFFYTFPKIDKRNPVVTMLPLIEKGKPVAYYRGFNPAFAFYLGTPIPKLKTPTDVEKFLSNNQRVYVLTRKKYLKDLKAVKNIKILSIRKDLFEKTSSVLISNR
ncbi:MAG: glycosyltransferase family 39 protein [Aquificae bacterium]|nr:glycosyltransferase family 39 protein [Aquificota bacterium]